MKLTEAEMRMVFQIESTNQNAALNEIYMTWRYAPNPATKETAEGLLDKLRPLSDQECMDLIRKVQAEYRLPEKARTIGEMLAEARQQSGASRHGSQGEEPFPPCPNDVGRPGDILRMPVPRFSHAGSLPAYSVRS